MQVSDCTYGSVVWLYVRGIFWIPAGSPLGEILEIDHICEKINIGSVRKHKSHSRSLKTKLSCQFDLLVVFWTCQLTLYCVKLEVANSVFLSCRISDLPTRYRVKMEVVNSVLSYSGLANSVSCEIGGCQLGLENQIMDDKSIRNVDGHQCGE